MLITRELILAALGTHRTGVSMALRKNACDFVSVEKSAPTSGLRQ